MREPSAYVPILYNKHSRFYRVTVLQYELVKEKEWLLLCISADVFEQTDQIWKIFKSFSLLVVKEGKGSIHRLLAQALRVSQNTQDARRHKEICLRAVLQALQKCICMVYSV